MHAIAKHGIPVSIALYGLVLAEGFQEVRKRLLGNIFCEDGFAKRHEHGMRWFSFVTRIQLALPPIQQFECARRIGDFVAEIVRPAAIRIDVVEMLVQRFGEKPGYDVEILVVMRGQPTCVPLRHFGRAGWLRRVPCDVDFAGEQHQEGISSNDLVLEAGLLEGLGFTSHQSRVANYGLTASLISPLRDFMRANACGRSASRISSVTKSRAEMSPRRIASSASRKNRGV